MADVPTDIEMSAQEYLAWEREQDTKHEFDEGRIVAMAGGSPRHNALCAAVIRELGNAYRGGPCRPLASEQRVSVRFQRKYVYPEVTVVCGPIELEDGTRDVATNPRVIIEVLSETTESHDRGGKWEAYRRLPSLEDYVLVSQRSVSVEHYRRQQDGSWRYTAVTEGEQVTVASEGVLHVDRLYEGVFELPSDESLAPSGADAP